MGVDSDLIPALEEAVARLLSPRQSQVITMHLGLCGHRPHTFAQIGEVLGVAPQRAHAIQKAALSQLREDPTLELLFEQTQ